MTFTVAQIEAAGYQAWSPDEMARIEGWTVVSNGGFTRRLNCAWTTTRADTSLETGGRIEEWLAKRRAPMAIRVTPLVPVDTVDTCASSWGLTRRDDTLVLVAVPGAHSGGGIMLVDPRTPAFVNELFHLNGRSEESRPAWDRLVERLGRRGIGLWLPGRAVGLAAEIDGVGLVYSVAVDEANRREGLAVRVMGAAHSWASEAGAKVVSLQVLGTNTAARALYDALDYEHMYTYHYLQRPDGSADRGRE